MTCRDIIGFLDDYVSGELPEVQRAVFEKHVACCPPCKNYLQSYEATIRLGKVACCESKEPPPIPEELVKAILAARARRG